MIYIGLAVDIILTKYCNNYKFLAVNAILPKCIWKIDLTLAPKSWRKWGENNKNGFALEITKAPKSPIFRAKKFFKVLGSILMILCYTKSLGGISK